MFTELSYCHSYLLPVLITLVVYRPTILFFNILFKILKCVTMVNNCCPEPSQLKATTLNKSRYTCEKVSPRRIGISK